MGVRLSCKPSRLSSVPGVAARSAQCMPPNRFGSRRVLVTLVSRDPTAFDAEVFDVVIVVELSNKGGDGDGEGCSGESLAVMNHPAIAVRFCRGDTCGYIECNRERGSW